MNTMKKTEFLMGMHFLPFNRALLLSLSVTDALVLSEILHAYQESITYEGLGNEWDGGISSVYIHNCLPEPLSKPYVDQALKSLLDQNFITVKEDNVVHNRLMIYPNFPVIEEACNEYLK